MLKRLESTIQRRCIVCIINILNSPPKSFESTPNILTECKVGFTLNGYFIVIVNPAEVCQLKMASK